MARMIGRTQWHQACRYGCCRGWVNVHSAKRREEAEWKAETVEQIVHGNYCGDYYCVECGGDGFDYDHYDNAELDDIPGVWCNVDYRNDPWYIRTVWENSVA